MTGISCLRTLPPHGTENRYNTGCRCQPCRSAHAAGARQRRRMKAYGQWTPRSVPNTGARRRVEALACLGWSMRSLSRMLGWHADRLQVLLSSYDGVSPANHARICALYDRLWDKPAPQRTKGERISARRAIAIAQRLGYKPPLAWDDDTIDDPAARPALANSHGRTFVDRVAVEEAKFGRPVRLTPDERRIAVAELTAAGYTAQEIADRVGVTARTAVRTRSRVRRERTAA